MKNMKLVYIILLIAGLGLAIFAGYQIVTLLGRELVTTTSQYNYSHDPAKNVNITLLCTTKKDCQVNVTNSTGSKINVTIWTTAPVASEYKGPTKVWEAFQKNVTFVEGDGNLALVITLLQFDEILELVPSSAHIEIEVPEGTEYTLTKKWPY